MQDMTNPATDIYHASNLSAYLAKVHQFGQVLRVIPSTEGCNSASLWSLEVPYNIDIFSGDYPPTYRFLSSEYDCVSPFVSLAQAAELLAGI